MIDGFSIIGEQTLSFFNGRGIWLRHDRTGLEIFKFVTDKINNYFCFNFKTPLENDTGVAHILEHSVLHGSEKYPDSELFFKLQQKSPCKDLNAATAKTYTSFYAETCVPKDFYNLLDMMGDSLFFPLLTDEVFMQEGWRIDVDEEGNPKLNGVVYNEMNNDDVKGSFFYRKLNRDFMPGSNENFNNGGDPLYITDCSVEDVRAFHKKYYVPKNCMLFLFGNMDLEEQLKFLDEKLLSRLPSDTVRAPLGDDVIPFTEPKDFEVYSPHYGTDDSSVELRFCIKDGDRDEINLRDDFFNLLNYALAEELMTPKFGSSADVDTFGTSGHRIFSVSLYGVSKGDVPAAKEYLFSLLEKIASEGIDSETIEVFCINQDNNYEDNEFELIPSSLNDPCFSGWMESDDPFVNLVDPESFWTRDRNLFTNPPENFFQDMAKKYLTENNHRSFITIHPDEKYFEKLQKAQDEKFIELITNLDKNKLKENIEKYNQFQKDCIEGKYAIEIPKLKISDLPLPQDVGLADCEKIKTENGEVYIFSSCQDINKKTNYSILFPVDTLTPEELFYFNESVPFFKKLGFGNYDIKESYEIMSNASVDVGDYSIDSSCIPVYCDDESEYVNRYWFSISFSIFNRKIEEGLKLIKEWIFNKNFNDEACISQYKIQYKRFLDQRKDDKAAAYGGHYIHAQCTNRLILNDYLSGPQVLKLYEKIKSMAIDEVVEKTFEVYRKVISGGAVFNVYASKSQLSKSKEALINFINDCKFNSLQSAVSVDVLRLRKEMNLSDSISEGSEINTIITTEENNVSMAFFNSAVYPSKEYAAEDALVQWFSNTVLYEQIRKCNGAYDVRAGVSASDGTVRFQTTRDPNPAASLKIYQNCLKELASRQFSEDDLNEIVIRTYGLAVGDISPKERGSFCFSRCLSGLHPEYRKKRLQNLLELKVSDIEDAAKRLYENSKNMKAMIITDDEKKAVGNIIARVM